MSIEIANESNVELDEADIRSLVLFGMNQLKVHPAAEVAVVFVDEEVMEQLHVQWMGEPGPTDVLSFPIDELRPGRDGEVSTEGILGDIVVCPAVAQKQADAQGHALQTEVQMLTIHGLLHLLGFDHAEPDEEAEMFGLQGDILTSYRAGL